MAPPTPEDRRYTRHCQGCPSCRSGGQCKEALGLLIDADAADWRRFNPAATAAGTRPLRAAHSETAQRD